jgi:hypothetical protein
LDGEDLEAVLCGDGAILIEHGVAEIDDGDDGAGGSEKGALQTAAGSETENFSAADVSAEPIFGIENGQGILEIAREDGPRMSILTADAIVPGALVVFEFAPHRSILPCKMAMEMK